MESNNWRPTQPQPDQPQNNTDVGGWRTQFSPESRHRVISKIIETLKKHYPYPDQLSELHKVVVRFEEKIYSAAASQEDYLRKITMKLLTMDKDLKTQNMAAGSLATNPASSNQNPMEPVPQNMQVQRNNLGQGVLMPSATNQPEALQQMLAPNLPGIIASTPIQSSTGLASTLPPVSGMNQSPISNLINQNSDMQNIADASQNGDGNSTGQGAASYMFNNQKPVPGRQQFQQQDMYQQQPQQFMKQKQLQQEIIPHSLTQSAIQQQQQQHLLQPNQMQSSQQAGNSTSNAVLQQHPQSVLRQHPQQTSIRHQQQMAHQSTRSSQPEQQLQTSRALQSLMGQQLDATNMQPAQLHGQQNMPEMPQQQQRLITQQNNISNMQQQQLITQQHTGPQGNVSGLQQQLHGTRSSNSDMQANQHQMHVVYQNMGPMLQKNLQPATSLIANQGQHSQPSQPLIKSQIQSESAQLQQHLGMNQQQRDVQQKLQPSGTLVQSLNISDHQKQMYQSQKALPEASSTSTDSLSQTGHPSFVNWQEEAYNKITNLKETYFTEIRDLYVKVSNKQGQLGSLPQQSNTVQLEKLNTFRIRLKKFMAYLLVSKSDITLAHRERLPIYEKQLVTMLNQHRPRRPGHVALSHENHLNPSLQSANIQGPVMMEQKNTSLQQSSNSSLLRVSNAQENMIGSVQPEPNVDAGQDSRLASLQKGADRSLQQKSVNVPQQTTMNALPLQDGANSIQHTISNLQSTNCVNQQHVREQQLMQSQQLKHQFQQRHQQMMQKQQHAGLLSAHQVPQLQQMTKVNDVNIRQGFGVKPGAFSQHHATGQRSVYHHQIKSGVSFPTSSPQMLQTSSPQILQNSSSQADQQNMLPAVSKDGTPLQSANSPFTVPTPSTPLAPSPMQGDSEKLAANVSPRTDGNIRVQQSAVPRTPTQSLAIETSGTSASPLLAEFSNQDDAHGTTSAAVTKSSLTEEPLDRLIKAVKSISNEALTASVNDIGSVVSMIDRIAGSAPGNGSRAAVGEELVAMTKCRLQAKKFATRDKCNGSKKMKRCTSSIPLVVVETNGSCNDSFTQPVGSELSDVESTATSRAKRPRTEVNDSLLKEISDINQRLIDTMVNISEEDVFPSSAAEVASDGGQGVIVKCSYNAVALSLDFKSQYATRQLSPIQPLHLLVPSNYPNCSPVLLGKLPVTVSNENEDLSMKAKSKFSRSLRSLSQPMSLKEMASAWDSCARAVISEYAQARGGGSFSSRYGSWESVLNS